jgi:hypothetical protein
MHAMEMPNDRLFVFRPDELKSLNMVTADAASGPAGSPASAAAKTGL